MAADITQAVTVATPVTSGFPGMPGTPASFTPILFAATMDATGFGKSGGSGGDSGGSNRPTSGMLYPRGQG